MARMRDGGKMKAPGCSVCMVDGKKRGVNRSTKYVDKKIFTNTAQPRYHLLRVRF